MDNWWLVKRYADEPIRISPKAAERVILQKSQGYESIPVDKSHPSVAANSISSVDETTERYNESQYILEADKDFGTGPYGSGNIALAPDHFEKGVTYEGGVICNWYKKNIGQQEWDRYYGKHPGYYRIDAPDKGIWVAIYLPVETNTILPKQLVLCEEQEIKYLDKIR